MNAHEIERLAEAVVRRVTVEIEASGRHVHLSRAGVDQLFGVGYRLNRSRTSPSRDSSSAPSG